MTEKNTGGPAFPRPYSHDGFNDDTRLAQSGMTLRDYFAAHAPEVPMGFDKKPYKKAVQTGRDRNEVLTVMETDVERLLRWRWHYADAMLKAREV